MPVTSDDEFGTWAERFNRMAESLADTIGRLEAAEAQNRRFVADVAHELRTPLAALVAEASILREHLDSLPPESRRAGELLVADVGRLRSLVDDLMEVSRFDARAEQIALEPVDVAAPGRGRSPRPACRRPRSTSPTTPIVIDTDPRRLERILGNLLDNAREHAPGRAGRGLAGRRSTVSWSIAVVRSRPRRPARPARAHLRALLQGRPVAPRREQRPRPGDRRGARGAARRLPHARANRVGGGLRIELRLPVT